MTPEQIADTVTVTGAEPLDPAIWVSTRNFLLKPKNDRWFRARIDKATGIVTYQIYFVMTARGDAYRPSFMTFEGAQGLARSEVEVVNRDVSCSGICYITEESVSTFRREDLEHAAKGATPGQDVTWPVKLFGQYQDGVEILTFKTEISGFLLAVDNPLSRLK